MQHKTCVQVGTKRLQMLTFFYMSYLANKATVSAFTDELKFEKSGKGRK